MWPRFKLLRELLSEKGSFWMTLDDNEVHRARMVLDEIFGAHNFIATVIWRKNYSPKSTAQFFSEDHDYLIVYANDKTIWRPNLLPRSQAMDAGCDNPDNDPRGPWKPGDLSARNPYSLGTYQIVCPSGRVIKGPPKGNYWRVSKEKFRELDADKRIWWGPDGNNVPAIKRFLNEVKEGLVPQTFWDYADVGHTYDAQKEVLAILDFADSPDVFITPKPVKLIRRIIHLATGPDALVLDSFAGSGTTAQAVLEANAEDGGTRRFILVECEAYGLQGWRRHRVYPDFIFALQRGAKTNRIVVVETKGDYLKGDDTEYKRRLLDLLSNAYAFENVHVGGELELVIDSATTVVCDLVFGQDWKNQLHRRHFA